VVLVVTLDFLVYQALTGNQDFRVLAGFQAHQESLDGQDIVAYQDSQVIAVLAVSQDTLVLA
jgi:hypothetical protein